jgi:hypothetical protein
MSITINGSGTVTGISATGISAQPAFPGNILQVVYASTTTLATNTTSTYADTGLTSSITPTSASSKVLVLVSQNGVFKSVNNSANGVNIKLFRGATALASPVGYSGTTLNVYPGSVSFCLLDAPGTTGATTYKTQFANFTNANGVGVQDQSSRSTITLMEVAA